MDRVVQGTMGALGLALYLFSFPSAWAFEPLYERAPIHYHDTEPNTKVTRWFATEEARIALSSGTDQDTLGALLKGLDVPVESQILVYSKTSAQNSRISPKTPRAIYFSDDVYIGWVQGGEIEVASFDEKLGMVFHLVRLSQRGETGMPSLVRERSCLNCHAGSSNRNFPGVMVRSVYAGPTGQPLFQAGTFHTRHDSPIGERWGGWYVTGVVDEETHLGNCIAEGGLRSDTVELVKLSEEPVEALDDFFETGPYLNGGRSDVVALMILEHQVGVHNKLVEANITTRVTLHRDRELKQAFGEPFDGPLSETNQRILDHLADDVLEGMLYADEFALPGGVQGGPEFAAAFSRAERKSSAGRSLRDLRLYERIMKYRCSHLIYSEAFDHLPQEIRSLILTKLHGVLTSASEHPDFVHLSDSERDHIHLIVSETVSNLPAVWTE
ncbi:MAG: hypothetical protein AAGC68_00245 [Verrucomicrobiota bacterium]